jgi:hypothetical protein
VTLDQEEVDALRLRRARADEEQARAEIAEAKRDVERFRDALRVAHRRVQEAERRAERAVGVRRALARGRGPA